jgi:hypothetical protein
MKSVFDYRHQTFSPRWKLEFTCFIFIVEYSWHKYPLIDSIVFQSKLSVNHWCTLFLFVKWIADEIGLCVKSAPEGPLQPCVAHRTRLQAQRVCCTDQSQCQQHVGHFEGPCSNFLSYSAPTSHSLQNLNMNWTIWRIISLSAWWILLRSSRKAKLKCGTLSADCRWYMHEIGWRQVLACEGSQQTHHQVFSCLIQCKKCVMPVC